MFHVTEKLNESEKITRTKFDRRILRDGDKPVCSRSSTDISADCLCNRHLCIDISVGTSTNESIALFDYTSAEMSRTVFISIVRTQNSNT